MDPDALPDDPAALQQMLRELYAENDKLRLLIERLTRHQFGRRSEQLTIEQLQLGLEDQEQVVAEHQASQAAGAPAARSQAHTCGGAQPWRTAVTSAALRGGDRCCARGVPLLRRSDALHRRIAHRAARHRAGTAASAGDASAALCLSHLRGSGRGRRSPGTPDRWRHADRSADHPRRGQQVSAIHSRYIGNRRCCSARASRWIARR